MRFVLTFSTLTLAFTVSACGSSGPTPHDASTVHHEAEAALEDREAAEHAAQYDPDAATVRSRCRPTGRGVSSTGTADVEFDVGFCWTSVVNPTAKHLEQAKQHRKLAAEHRAASQALLQAEEKSCAEIAPDDRDISPFEHVDDILRVTKVLADEKPALKGGAPAEHSSALAGVRVVFRAVPGMTVESLQRVLDCHLARNASLGHSVPEMPDCPLVPNGISAKAEVAEEGFAVHILATDPKVADEVYARARRLQVAHQH